MSGPRMRMVAGPNGSGKSTLFDFLQSKTSYPLGHCLNPDLVEQEIGRSGRLDFSLWRIEAKEIALRDFLTRHPLATKLRASALVTVNGNVADIPVEARGGYLTAVICDFVRRQWLATAQAFTFETVMSSRDKVDLLSDARAEGFRTYLYFICTDSFIINRERIYLTTRGRSTGWSASTRRQS